MIWFFLGGWVVVGLIQLGIASDNAGQWRCYSCAAQWPDPIWVRRRVAVSFVWPIWWLYVIGASFVDLFKDAKGELQKRDAAKADEQAARIAALEKDLADATAQVDAAIRDRQKGGS